MTKTKTKTDKGFAQRMLGAVDLAIDFATLGEYGLEPICASDEGTCRERPGRRAGWEALATARRGRCQRPRRARAQLRG